jgi:hypothetical protein
LRLLVLFLDIVDPLTIRVFVSDRETRDTGVFASDNQVFICMSFFVALFNYIRFAREVIWQM